MFLQRYREALAGVLSNGPTPSEKLPISDPFLLTAALQKSLRRGDVAVAGAAAKSLIELDAGRLWRRLVIVACEDFGISDLELTKTVVAIASDTAWRKKAGGDHLLASWVIQEMAARPRDRRVDEAYMLVVALTRLSDPMASIRKLALSTPLEAAVCRAVGVVAQCERTVSFRNLRAVLPRQCDLALAAMKAEGLADGSLIEACVQARRTSQCLLPVLLPLLSWAGPTRCGVQDRVREVPPVLMLNGIPSYALDGFTRIGRAALITAARADRRLSQVIAGLPTGKARMDALSNLLFVVEGGVCTWELSDAFYNELKVHSLGCWTGLKGTALEDGFEAMKAAVPQLNHIRASLLSNELCN